MVSILGDPHRCRDGKEDPRSGQEHQEDEEASSKYSWMVENNRFTVYVTKIKYNSSIVILVVPEFISFNTNSYPKYVL